MPAEKTVKVKHPVHGFVVIPEYQFNAKVHELAKGDEKPNYKESKPASAGDGK